jgi:hypothetical protein
VTPLNGIFSTTAEGEEPVGDSIAFECTDKDKVPNNGFPEIEVTCVIEGYYATPEWPGLIHTNAAAKIESMQCFF